MLSEPMAKAWRSIIRDNVKSYENITPRERAKLGHYWIAIGPMIDPETVPKYLTKRAKHRGLVTCPGCGAPVHDKPKKLVQKRKEK